jgi:hypothetical protein
MNIRMEDNIHVVDFPKHGGGGSGGDDMLEKRVKKLEDDLAGIRTDIAVINQIMQTKKMSPL